MQHAMKCDNEDKPGKNELVKQTINVERLRYYPDSDRKRITRCREYIVNQSKKR